MDLIGESPVLRMSDKSFRIFSRNRARAPQFIGTASRIVNSLVSEGCIINGYVENSILSGGVIIEEGAVVRDSVIMEDVTIRSGASVFSSIIDSDAVIGERATVGTDGADKASVSVVAKYTRLPAGAHYN